MMHNSKYVYNREQVARKNNKNAKRIIITSAKQSKKYLMARGKIYTKYLINSERHHEQKRSLAEIFYNSCISPLKLVLYSVEDLTEKFDLSTEEGQQMLAIAAANISPASSIVPVWQLLSHNTKSVPCEGNNSSAKQNMTNTLLTSPSNIRAKMEIYNSTNFAELENHTCSLSWVSTGIDMLDRALLGGLRVGTLVELTGQSNSSTTELALRWSVQTACAAWNTINNNNNSALLSKESSNCVTVLRQGVIWLHTDPTPPAPAQIKHMYNHFLNSVLYKSNKEKNYGKCEPLIWFRHVEEMDSFGNNDLAEIDQFVNEINKWCENKSTNDELKKQKCECCNTIRSNASNGDEYCNGVTEHDQEIHVVQCEDMKCTERTSVSLVVIDNFSVLVRRAYSGSTSNDGITQQMAIGQLMHRLKQFAEHCNLVIVIITQLPSANLQCSSTLNNSSEFGRVLEHAVNVRLALVERYTRYNIVDRYIHVLKSPTCASLRIPVEFFRHNRQEESKQLKNIDDDDDDDDDDDNNSEYIHEMYIEDIMASVNILDYIVMPTFIFA